MTPEQLIKKYDTGAITARELVEGVWERAEACPHGYSDQDPIWDISLGGELFTVVSIPEKYAPDEKSAWVAAAAFTRERIEEIKKARRDTQSVEDWDADRKRWIELLGLGHEEPEYIASISRILTLVRAHLDELCQGIKPEALKP